MLLTKVDLCPPLSPPSSALRSNGVFLRNKRQLGSCEVERYSREWVAWSGLVLYSLYNSVADGDVLGLEVEGEQS